MCEINVYRYEYILYTNMYRYTDIYMKYTYVYIYREREIHEYIYV